MLFTLTLPAILVSEDTGLVGVFEGNKLHLSSIRNHRFVADRWKEALGIAPTDALNWPEPKKPTDKLLIYQEKVAYLQDIEQFKEACESGVSVIISKDPLRGKKCARPHQKILLIDRFDGWRNGSYALFPKTKGYHAVHTRKILGVRPWTAYSQLSPRHSSKSLPSPK